MKMKNQTKSNLRDLPQPQIFFLILLFLASSILIASCDARNSISGRETYNTGNNKSERETSNAGNNTPESEAARLNTNRDEWRSSRNVLNYRMTIELVQPGHEGVGGAYVVTVRNG